jgi:hypothetical protein
MAHSASVHIGGGSPLLPLLPVSGSTVVTLPVDSVAVVTGPVGSPPVVVPGSLAEVVVAESVPFELLPPSVVVGVPSVFGSPLLVCPDVAEVIVGLGIVAVSVSPLATPPSSPQARSTGATRHAATKPNFGYRIFTS